MKDYTSCFIGVPIAEKYQAGFESLLGKIPKINAHFKQPHSKTPHITVYYLDKQSQNDIRGIAEKVNNSLHLLAGIQLHIGGFGYFRGDNPKVVFLSVKYSKELKAFNDTLSNTLAVYSASDNKLPFDPHVTVAWVGDPEAQQDFKKHQPELQILLNKISWSFEISELILYGVDSTKEPESYEKLMTFKVK